jgi:glycosyltransferase involved in cell wall biosynthesis
MRISVVIPVRNEEHSIRALLNALLTQTRVPDEVVITDGGSSDQTVNIVNDYSRGDSRIRLVREREALPGRGRNVGVANATGDLIAFVDAGITPEKDWLMMLADKVEEEPSLDVVYGNWRPVTDTFFKECSAIAYVPPPQNHNGEMCRPKFIASSLLRRAVWNSTKGFPEHLRSAEDLLFMNELELMGFRHEFEPRAIVNWEIQPTFARTFKRFVGYACNNIRAGLWNQWQAAIFRQYSLLFLLLLLSLFGGLWWGVSVISLWLLMLIARSIVALWRNRTSFPGNPVRNARRLLLLVPILAMLDVAALVGTIKWLTHYQFRLFGETENTRKHT